MNSFFSRLIGKSPSSEDPTRNGEIKDQDIIELRQRIQDQIKKGILLQGKEKYNIKIAKREAEHIRDIMYSTYTRYGGILMLEEGESSETIFSGGNGLQALIKRKDICRDMDIIRDDPAGIVVRLRSEKEKELIHERAYRKGYTFSMTITLLLAVLIALLSFPQAFAEKVESHHLHALAMPRHKAVGMWLPDEHHILKIRQHRNSVAQPRKDVIKLSKSFYQPSGAVLARQNWANKQLAGAIWSPEQLDGAREKSIKGTQNNLEEMNEFMFNNNEKRVPAAVIGVAIKAAGYAITGLVTVGCTLYNQSTKATKTGKVLCIVIGALISALPIWGGHFVGNKFVESSGQIISDIAMTNIGSTAQTIANARRRKITKLWHEDETEWLKETYKKSLLYDKEVIRKGLAYFDKHTGQMLTAWDLILSYVHPIQHSFTEGYQTTIWHEKTDTGHRRHTYTPISHSFGKRQCGESDTEEGEPQPYNYCEQGGYAGFDGVYNGYDYRDNRRR